MDVFLYREGALFAFFFLNDFAREKALFFFFFENSGKFHFCTCWPSFFASEHVFAFDMFDVFDRVITYKNNF